MPKLYIALGTTALLLSLSSGNVQAADHTKCLAMQSGSPEALECVRQWIKEQEGTKTTEPGNLVRAGGAGLVKNSKSKWAAVACQRIVASGSSEHQAFNCCCPRCLLRCIVLMRDRPVTRPEGRAAMITLR